MSRHAIIPLVFIVAALASAEPTGASGGKSSGAYFDSGDKSGAKKTAISGGAYELRGFFGSGENLEVSVRRAGFDKAQWLRVGQKSGGLLIEKADAKTGTATLVVNGVRQRLRLAGEVAPSAPATPLVVEEAKPVAADYKSREFRQKRMKELSEKMSEAQNAEFGRAADEAIKEELKKRKGSVFANDPKQAEEAMELQIGVMLKGSEAAHKLPDKDGKITPVPADLELLLREEYKAGMEMVKSAKARRAEREKAASTDDTAKNAVTQKEGTVTLSGATYTGSTTVNSGTLSASGSETPPAP